MSLPGNGIFVVRGEMSTLMTAMKRGARWNSTSYHDEEQDGLTKQFVELKQILNQIEDLKLIDPSVFLGPFLDVIRTEETTGAITSLALAAVNKFLSYGLIDPTHPTIAITVENIADAVTHARFLGTDQASDAVTLMRVVEVMHTLMRSPEGSSLTNESVCEIMLSCFKICFEPRLNELLRRTAEQALKDMVLLLFMRLPQFSEDRHPSGLLRKFKMIAGSIEHTTKKRKSKLIQKQNLRKTSNPRINTIKAEEKLLTVESGGPQPVEQDPSSPSLLGQSLKAPPLATTPATPGGNIVDMQGKITQTPTTALNEEDQEESAPIDSTDAPGESVKRLEREESTENDADIEDELQNDQKDEEKLSSNDGEYINSVGVRFTQQNSGEIDGANLLPYGLPCIQELFRFLILLCNPLDKQNTDAMIHMGLALLTVALEVGADNIGKYDTLLALVKDDLCRNLFALLNSERITIFAADLQVCFLLFESLRSHLKCQLEFFLAKLSEIIGSENSRMPYETKELALDNLLQLWRIPGFVSELYINYDCDLYCTDVFENITKLLSKTTLSATSSVYSIHIISLETLLSVIESLEKNYLAAKTGESIPPQNTSRHHSRNNSGVEKITIESDLNASGGESSVIENISTFMKHNSFENAQIGANSISKEQLAELKSKKRILMQGTEFFNQRPDKGIQFLQENNILNSELDPKEVALFLRENSGLDKKMIGEFISKKKNVENKILENFVSSFDFANMRVDQALRLYLETFRLPGEAPLIFLVMEYFADHWHKCNNEPFANTDAAFRLAYAIIMLNMDQHNYNAKRMNIPMTAEDFCKNLRGLNGNKDFDQDMLLEIYNAIKNEEIVMPAEQTGLVRENYLWKVLLRRGAGKDGVYRHVNDVLYDKELFNIVWGPTLTALSFMFDKSSENGYQKILSGFSKCAGISAFYSLNEDFDALVLTLCKFSTLLSVQPEISDLQITVAFGTNAKAQLAMKTVFGLVHEFGDCMRESWKNILEVIVQLFRLKLLPKTLMEVEDFCEQSGKTALLILDKPSQKSEAGLFSSLYSYLASEGQRQPTYEEQEIIKVAKKCIKECQIDQIVSESKFVQFESLQELIKAVLLSVKAPSSHKSVGLPYNEDVVVFLLEFLVRTVIQNRDRMIPLWNSVRDEIYLLLMGGAQCGYDYLLNRTTIALLKLAIYLMRNEELCPIVLQSLKMLLMLKPNVIYRISKQISIGIYELLKTSAQNIHTEADWQIIFTMLECVGAGAVPPDFDDGPPLVGTKSDGALSSEEDSGLPDRGYTSDSEVVNAKNDGKSTANTPFVSPSNENWILVNKDSDSVTTRSQSPIGNTLIYPCKLLDHVPFALFKCWDSLAFIVRNVAHITPYNFEICVRCIRTFVECSLNGGIRMRRKLAMGKQTSRKKGAKKDASKGKKKDDSSDSEDEELTQQYETIAIQLLDLMYTLYTRTAQIFRWWAEESCNVPQCSALWAQGWCPLLQGIARLALDRRREVRTYAISCLQQRALLVHDLQTLSGTEWASCFRQVLFPLLNELLPEASSCGNIDQMLLEESRIRTATIMSKVFLHHLTPLIELPNFNDLWLEILDYIEKFMKVGSDMLYEQMLEILKNMLLVMHSVRVFHCRDGSTHSPLWDVTWKRIGEFLPNLQEELFKSEVNHPSVAEQHQIGTPSLANTAVGTVAEGVEKTFPPTIHTTQSTPASIATISSDISAAQLQQPLGLSITQSLVDVKDTKQNLTSATNRGSIILQPPSEEFIPKPLILGQSAYPSPQHNVPILIPQNNLLQQTLPTTPISSFPTAEAFGDLSKLQTSTSATHPITPPSLDQNTFVSPSIQQMPNTHKDGKLPDIVTDTTQSAGYKRNDDNQTATEVYGDSSSRDNVGVNQAPAQFPPQMWASPEFSNIIELPETPPPTEYTDGQYQVVEKLNDQTSETVDNRYEVASNSRHDTAAQLSSIGSSQTADSPRVPISHLIAGNQYPSLNKMPPPNIVQSFAPMFVHSEPTQSGFEIYSEYVQNPYNLTLYQPANSLPETRNEQSTQEVGSEAAININETAVKSQSAQQPHPQQAVGVSQMFQSANYFGGVDQSVIPPGSEVLFGRP